MERGEDNILENINSIYILNKILSYLTDSDKLEIIRYNKNLQEKIGISINHYMKESGKYIIGKRNGIAKEYGLNTNLLLFEGEYLNGKRNGHGKEYYNSINNWLKFEGEYLNGKKIKGKGYSYKYFNQEVFILNEGKEKSFIFLVNCNSKEIILMDLDGMEEDIIWKEK